MSFTPLLTARSLVLAKIEPVYNQDANPTPAADAFLVSETDVRIDTNILERNNYKNHLSPDAIITGRKLVNVTFTHELKASGTVGTAAKIGTMLRACGFLESIITAVVADQIGDSKLLGEQAGPVVTWAKTTVPTAYFGSYRITVVTPGATAVAGVRVSHYNSYDPDPTVLPGETFEFLAEESSGTTCVVNVSDPTSVTYTFAGTPNEGSTVTVLVGSLAFSYVVQNGDASTDVADALQLLIDADARLGASVLTGVITVTFTSGAAEQTITTAVTEVLLGNSVAGITPSWTGDLVLGDSWVVDLYQVGVLYRPRSNDFESATIYVYYDGLLHKVTGCMGSVTFNGESGNYGTAAFNFTGQYIEPVDEPVPATSVFEQTKPQQVELAQLAIDGIIDLCAQSFTVDMANNVVERDCINGSDGVNGVRLVSRNPSGTVNPEMALNRNHRFWKYLADGTQLPFHVRVGDTAGNIVHFMSDSAQYGGLTYGDRNGIRTVDVNLRFSSFSAAGNDEMEVLFA